MITRTKLLKAPAEYGRTYAFVIERGGSSANLKNKTVANAPPQIEEFQQVHGDSRACTASLGVRLRTCTVKISAYSQFQDTEATFPVYYLPWLENRAVRMTLKPSKHQAVAREPDVFFTANLNGCMVTVEGPPDRPTVYHSNVAEYLGSPASTASLEEKLAEFYIGMKVIAMEEGYKKMSNQYDKVGEARKGLLHPKSITQDKYQVLVGRPTADKALREARGLIARDTKIKYDEVSAKLECEESMGSVFGVRDDAGFWSFYYQRLLLVSYFRNAGTPTQPKFVRERDDWRCLTCDMFWPFGSGSMVI